MGFYIEIHQRGSLRRSFFFVCFPADFGFVGSLLPQVRARYGLAALHVRRNDFRSVVGRFISILGFLYYGVFHGFVGCPCDALVGFKFLVKSYVYRSFARTRSWSQGSLLLFQQRLSHNSMVLFQLRLKPTLSYHFLKYNNFNINLNL